MKNNFKTMALALCCLGMAAFTACDNDDKQTTATLAFNPTEVEVEVDATTEVVVSGGAEPYTVTTSSAEIATATVENSEITITGVADGEATITVKDANNVTGTIPVTVVVAPEE